MLTPSMLARTLALALVLFGSPAVTGVAPAPAGAMASAEAVYAAFTLNLTRFITWPPAAFASPGAPFVIGTFPWDPINAELDAAAKGESVEGHPVTTVRLYSLDDVQGCHLVYLSRGIVDPAAVLARVRRRPILTVSDAENFIGRGGQVQFVPQPPRTRLQISPANLRACGLEARSQLLRLATTP